ncbi:MAG TPA: serine hydrolase [Steroidobacteraceae bacterium]|jgi:CubicO group peptidase (beta-lactamase class C family)
MKILRRILAAIVLVLLAALGYLWLKPPALLRVGANYAAKIVCSNVFLADRDPNEVVILDVQAPGVWILHYIRVRVDREHGVVHAGFLGFIGGGLAVARPGKGCTVLPDGKLNFTAIEPARRAPQPTPASSASESGLWPDGAAVQTNPALDRLLANDALAGPGARALVVVDHGRIVAERYGKGFDPTTPLLGWSMTKTVTAGIVGLLVKDGKLKLAQANLWPASDGRERIRIADLLAMSSGLYFNENQGLVSDLTTMLYLEPDMAGFARAQPMINRPGEVWSYSSGTALILSRIVQDALGLSAPAYIDERLFKPLGITTATMEQDESGTLVGSSYIYASARDWARYAQFLLQDGVWHGQALLPVGYVSMMATPAKASGGEYGQGLVWLWGSDAKTAGENPDTEFNIPPDTFYMMGHDGQSIAIIRSRQLVVVRMGLTPVADHYSPQPLLKAVLEAQAQR